MNVRLVNALCGQVDDGGGRMVWQLTALLAPSCTRGARSGYVRQFAVKPTASMVRKFKRDAKRWARAKYMHGIARRMMYGRIYSP